MHESNLATPNNATTQPAKFSTVSVGENSNSDNGRNSNTGGTATATGGGGGAQLSVGLKNTSVLAEQYVPQQLKTINLMPVNAPMASQPIPTLEPQLQQIYQNLVPNIDCTCFDNIPEQQQQEQQQQQQQQQHLFDQQVRPQIVYRQIPEIRYALNPPPQIHNSASLPTIDQNDLTPQDYIQTFRALLRRERLELLLLYERFSQYHHYKPPQPPRSQPPPPSQVQQLQQPPPPLQHGNDGIVPPQTIPTPPPPPQPQPFMGNPYHPNPNQTFYPPHFPQHQQQPFPPTQLPPSDPQLQPHSFPPPPPPPPPPPIPPQQQQQLPQFAEWKLVGIADASPALQPGDIMLIRPTALLSLPTFNNGWSRPICCVEIHAQVSSVLRGKNGTVDTVVSTWLTEAQNNILQRSFPQQHYNLRFIPSTKEYDRCITALDWCAATLPPNLITNLLLSPSSAPSIPSTSRFASSLSHGNILNKSQMEFVDMVLQRTIHASLDEIRPPMILTGPAGTGKTKALLTAILQVLLLDSPTVPNTTTSNNSNNINNKGTEESDDTEKRTTRRILVCTPSHTACNVITQRLSQHLSKQRLFRLLDSDRPIATVPSDILVYCRQDETSGIFTLPSKSELMQFTVIVCTCSDAHLLYCAGITNEQLRQRRRCFKNWLTTNLEECNMSATVSGVDEPHFTHLFIDEASQATEPETLIPISVVADPLPGSIKTEIALVGDPRQLSPKVYSNQAAECGLGKSWMERLLQRPVAALGGGNSHLLGPDLFSMDDFVMSSFTSRLVVFLTMNYRCHPAFLMMPSVLFYFDKLQCFKGVTDNDDDEESGGDSKNKNGEKDMSNHGNELSFLNGNSGGGGNKSSNSTGAQSTTIKAKGWSCRQALKCVENLAKLITVTKDNSNTTSDLPHFYTTKRSWPIHFRGVQGQDKSVSIDSFCGTDSWSNRQEADVVAEIVENLVAVAKVPTIAIGVMSPFRGQVVLIRQLLRQSKLGSINVGTVEDYQAVERPIIVLSLTRSNEQFVPHDIQVRAGLFGQPKRVNVAMTRAEQALIVVGNPVIMFKDPIWAQWLWFCLRNGLFYGPKVQQQQQQQKEESSNNKNNQEKKDYNAIISSLYRNKKSVKIERQLPPLPLAAADTSPIESAKAQSKQERPEQNHQQQQLDEKETKTDENNNQEELLTLVMSSLEEICISSF